MVSTNDSPLFSSFCPLPLCACWCFLSLFGFSLSEGECEYECDRVCVCVCFLLTVSHCLPDSRALTKTHRCHGDPLPFLSHLSLCLPLPASLWFLPSCGHRCNPGSPGTGTRGAGWGGGGAHSNSGGMRAERTQTQVKVKPGENILCIQKTLRRTESKQTVVYNQRLYWLGRAKPKVATPGVSSLLPLSPESALNRAGPLTSLLDLAVTASEA